MVALAVQTSPVGLVALALIVSGPAPLASRRSTLNEPLGARVVRVVSTTTVPLRRSSTSQATPLTFWSTSNSVFRRPRSRLTLSLARELPVHSPATRISLRLRAWLLLELLRRCCWRRAAARAAVVGCCLAAAVVAGGVVGAVLGERRGGRECGGGEH